MKATGGQGQKGKKNVKRGETGAKERGHSAESGRCRPPSVADLVSYA